MPEAGSLASMPDSTKTLHFGERALGRKNWNRKPGPALPC